MELFRYDFVDDMSMEETMRILRMMSLAVVCVISLNTLAQDTAKSVDTANNNVLVDRVDSTAFIQIEANSFRSLTPQQQKLAYWLWQASIAIDPIHYDQMSRFGLRQKRLLEGIVAHPQGIDPAVMKKISDFTKLFWSNRGNHQETTARKILPEFTFEELSAAAKQAQKNGAWKTETVMKIPMNTPALLTKELNDLKQSLFDPNFEPMVTAKSPKDGKDILQSSSNNYYSPNVSLADLKGFKEKYPLNSRLGKSRQGQVDGRGLSRGHAGWKSAGWPLCSVPARRPTSIWKRLPDMQTRSQDEGDPRPDQVLSDRRIQ